MAVLALLLAAGSPAGAVEREQMEAKLENLRNEIQIIRGRLDEALGERDQALDALAQAEREVSTAERARRQTETDIVGINDQLDALATEAAALEGQVALSAQALSRQLVLAYRRGGQSRLKLMLNQDDPRQLNRHLAYHGYLSRARLDLMNDLGLVLEQLNETLQQQEIQRNDLRRLADRQDVELRHLEAARVVREQALRTVEGRVQTRQQQLAELERDAAELAQLLDELASALADIPPEIEVPSIADLRGQLSHPVRGEIRHRFGEARAGDLTWNGWLIEAPVGTDVSAIAYGRVAYSDWLRGYGLILIIDHGDGFMSLYAHNEALLRDVGDWVRPGDVIASVGNSSGSGQSGLYFELRRNGQPINPTGWMSGSL